MTDIERLRNLSVPKGKTDCILDTDTYNEIDDQFALSLMMKSEKLNPVAIYAAPFFNAHSTSPEDGMEKSYDEIINLLTLMGRTDMIGNVYKGSNNYLTDEKTPQECPAARHLCEIADNYSTERPLYVVAIGAITNIASALIMKPEIAEKIVIVWLGGHADFWPDTHEFNMMQDVASARIVFGCGCPLVQLPCMGVVSAFTTTGPELEYWLKGKNPLCDYLVKHTVDEVKAYADGKVWSRVIWDVTAVAWLLNDNNAYMSSELVPSPIPEYDHHYGHDSRRHFIRRVTHINRDRLFQTLFDTLAK